GAHFQLCLGACAALLLSENTIRDSLQREVSVRCLGAYFRDARAALSRALPLLQEGCEPAGYRRLQAGIVLRLSCRYPTPPTADSSSGHYEDRAQGLCDCGNPVRA